jgi:hypothetical protein
MNDTQFRALLDAGKVTVRGGNPFFNNYIFKSEDRARMTVSQWDYPQIWFKPTYVQLSDGYEWHYKIDGIGRIYLLKVLSSEGAREGKT